MKLTGKYTLLVTGDISKLSIGHNNGAIGHLFQRLLTGEVAHMENLSNLGITVRYAGEDDEFVRVPRLEE